MRTIVIGDIHGCYKALQSLIDAVSPTELDTLVFLGDYVDRGPDSRGTVEFLLSLKKRFRTVFIKGNHELLFLDAVVNRVDPELWFHNGGRMTLTSYGGKIESIPRTHIEFIQSTIPYYEIDRHFFVHANYQSDLQLAETPPMTLYWEHLYERMPGPHLSGKVAWLGHSPQMNGWILDCKHLICIDTFCFGGMYLTAIDVDSREVWQTDRQGTLRGHRSPIVQGIKNLKRIFNRWTTHRT